MKNLNTLFSSNKKDDVTNTYLLLGVALMVIIGLNLYAYLMIIRINNIYNTLNNAAQNIRLKATDANLLYREIASGTSDKDLNAVWEYFDSASGDAAALAQLEKENEANDKLTAFKNMIINCNLASNDKNADMEKLKQDYDASYKDLTGFAAAIQTSLNENVQSRLTTIKILYGVLIMAILFMFVFTVYVIRNFISGHIALEKEIEETKNNLFMILNSIDSVLVVAMPDETITHWNKTAEKYFGYEADKVINMKICDVLPFFKNFTTPFQKVLQIRKPEEFHREKITIGDSERFINLKMSYGHGINGVVILFEDVTVQQVKDEQARQAQKMQVVENMIKSLAHDFNNVLGGITGTISMMKYSIENKTGSSEDAKGNIDLIESSAEKAYVMVQQLVSFSQKHDMQAAPVDLNSMVQHVLKICDNTFEKNIRIEGQLYDVKALTKADPILIEMALLNLCDNAVQAMTIMRPDGQQKGGTLTVTVDKIYPDKNYRQSHPQAMAPSYWILSVMDSGVGIAADVQPKIFDPFFTTKEKFKASGIGLSVVNDIVRQHRGFIDVESKPDTGTRMSIFIPEITVEPQVKQQMVADIVSDEQIPTGTGTILVADDEAVMRKTAKSILIKLGYQVIFAEDGEQTVKVFTENCNEIAAILLDMTMPKMSGKDAYVEIKKLKPDVKVLLVSGFKKDKRIEDALALGINGFIQKPYTLVDLAKEMRRIING